MAEILPGIHQILVNYNGRPLKLYVLRGSAASMLIDVGDMPVPEREVLPYLRAMGLDPAELTYVLITHPDVDHCAGLANMQRLAPQARVICGEADREQVESPVALVDQRYRLHVREHGVGPVGEAREKLLARAGAFAPVDVTFAGGETVRLGSGEGSLDVVRILRLPGHSHGHLGVYVPGYKTALIGDAVHDRYSPDLAGVPALPVTYMYVDEYLGTIGQLAGMAAAGKLERLYSAHWPDQVGVDAVSAWLARSREYVGETDEVLLGILRGAKEGKTLRELLGAVKPRLGTWPENRNESGHFFIAGHLERLAERGLIEARAGVPVRYYGRA